MYSKDDIDNLERNLATARMDYLQFINSTDSDDVEHALELYDFIQYASRLLAEIQS